MARYRERYASDDEDHGIGDIARRNAERDYSEQFGTGGRTQNQPRDYGNPGYPEPFDSDYRNDYGRYHERYGRGLVSGYRGRGPRNYTRTDERILEDICERLWDVDDVDASDITVQVKDGEVTLSGNVEQRWTRHRIEDIADACSGVRDIHDEIRVKRGEGI